MAQLSFVLVLLSFLFSLWPSLSTAFPLAGANDGIDSADSHRCKPANMLVRREWGALSKPERRAYIDAVLCLQSKPSIIPSGIVPGAKVRTDDFVAMHANLTRVIHLSGQFLSWHRNFVWLYEKALREECGYKGAQPYWNWPKWLDLGASPLFDGSDTSLSGDGVFVDEGPYPIGNDTLPHGTGGGCVKDGPFKNMVSNLGPFEFTLAFTGLPSNWTAHTPHCLVRDLNNAIAERYLTQAIVDDVLAGADIVAFQQRISPGADINLGPHGGGHWALGAGLRDFFASPADPAFFLHHGMIDKTWTEWQAMDPHNRQLALNGSSTILYAPDTPEVTLNTVQEFGYIGPQKRTRELMDVKGGEFCYRYE